MSASEPVTMADLAQEVAQARGDAHACKVAVLGTETQPGLRSKHDVLAQRVSDQDREQERRWSSIEHWLGQIDGRMAALEGRRLHPAVTLTLVVCALAIAYATISAARDVSSMARDTSSLVRLVLEDRAERRAEERAAP